MTGGLRLFPFVGRRTHRQDAGKIKLDEPAQSDRRNDGRDTGDKKPGNKITCGDVSNQTHQPWKQWIKREGTVTNAVCAVTKFRNFSVIFKIPLVPYLKPLVGLWLVAIPKHGIPLHAN